MVNAIENGYPQREIHNSAFKYQQQIEKNEKIIVGMNKFQGSTEPIPLLKINDAIEKDQITRLKSLKKSRNHEKVNISLKKLKDAATDDNINIIPLILDCVKNYCSVGEISNILRETWGEYIAPDIF